MVLHTAPTSLPQRPGATSSRTTIGRVAAVLAFVMLGAGCAAAPAPAAAPPAAVNTADLPVSSTYTVVDGAPADPAVGAVTSVVVHPERETVVRDAPDGRPIARIETAQFGDTWLPAIAEQGGFVQVLLPSKPNGSTGWLLAADLKRAVTPYVIKVHLRTMRMELVKDGKVANTWTIGIGKTSAPTPAGRTFVLGAFSDAKQKFSPTILPLGTHSPTHDTFGGGPGTVAIHTWPTADVFGTASSDGCIRVPADALAKLSEVPLGTLVMIDEG